MNDRMYYVGVNEVKIKWNTSLEKKLEKKGDFGECFIMRGAIINPGFRI